MANTPVSNISIIVGMTGITAAATAAVLLAAPADADPPIIDNCTTSVMNNGLDSYTYCTYTDGTGSYRIVTTCLGSTGNCTTRRAH